MIRWRLPLAVLGVTAAVVAIQHLESARGPEAVRAVPSPPSLFEDARSCPREHRPRDLARALEEMGRLRADRYPYDPHDGVLAVRDFGQARDCYQAAGEMEHAARAQAAAMMLRAKIETDYAAARMNLMRAVDSEHWTTALAEARRLLRLTHHLGAHDYAEFLQRIAGRASARASVEP